MPQKSETGHAAQNPVECMKRPIENNSSPGQEVYDPIRGFWHDNHRGGNNLPCHAIEISPAYCDVAVTRWQNFTGKLPGNMSRRAFLLKPGAGAIFSQPRVFVDGV